MNWRKCDACGDDLPSEAEHGPGTCGTCLAKYRRELGNLASYCERSASDCDYKAKEEQESGGLGDRSRGAAFLRGSASAFREVGMLIGLALTKAKR